MSYSIRWNVIVSQLCSGELVLAPRPVKQKLELSMSRSSLYLAASLLVLAACQPATDTTDDLVAEAPPIVAEDAGDASAETDVQAPEEAAVETTETVAAPAEATPIADDSAAPEADEHDHDEHEEHSDEDHDHDHNHDGAGEAHVHGLSE